MFQSTKQFLRFLLSNRPLSLCACAAMATTIAHNKNGTSRAPICNDVPLCCPGALGFNFTNGRTENIKYLERKKKPTHRRNIWKSSRSVAGWLLLLLLLAGISSNCFGGSSKRWHTTIGHYKNMCVCARYVWVYTKGERCGTAAASDLIQFI